MRILLDECVDEGLRHAIAGHVCQTCRFAGFKGLTNGKLLTAAENAGFNVIVTVDLNIQHQQTLHERALALVILQAPTTGLDDLLPLVPELLTAVEVAKPGEIVRIGAKTRI
ncbi:MAG TPA: hypothetical protein VN579_04960 [Bryobacteraceae bacterium]|nr:hypothetical protein [Bryobacteraceae bacterium]